MLEKKTQTSEYYKKLYDLKSLVEEGGSYSLVIKSNDEVIRSQLKENDLTRPAMTSIYYMLEGKQTSAFHILKSDEIWHYYDGDSSVNIYEIDLHGVLTTTLLGSPVRYQGAVFQNLVQRGNYFAAELNNIYGFALMGCTFAPGFSNEDFSIAQADLILRYPQHKELIARLFSKDLL
eukprot:403363562